MFNGGINYFTITKYFPEIATADLHLQSTYM